MVKHAIDGIEIFFALIVEALGFDLKLVEASFGIDEYRILAMFANVKLGFELLWRLCERKCLLVEKKYFLLSAHFAHPDDALLKTSEAHRSAGLR